MSTHNTIEKTANIRRALTRRCAALGIPVSATFELTPRCNLQCKMCYVRLTPEQMAPIGRERTAAEWLQLAAEAKEAGMTFLLITGGEPTLRSDFAEIYEGLAQMGLSISINTNGTLLTPALRDLWHRLPPAQVNITLYGTCREEYEALCGNPQAFDAVVDGLDWLQSEGILVHLNATMTPINQPKWREIENFARNRGLDLRMTTYCFPPVRREEGADARSHQACHGEHCLASSCQSQVSACQNQAASHQTSSVFPEYTRLSPEEAARLSLLDMAYRDGTDALRRRLKELDTPLPTDCSLDAGEPMRCMAAKSMFWVTWDGRMTPCGMLDQPVVRPFASDFHQAWEQLRSQSDVIRLCPDCVQCPDRSTCLNCAAVTYTETGRFDGKPEYMCRLSRAYREILTEMVKQLDF